MCSGTLHPVSHNTHPALLQLYVYHSLHPFAFSFHPSTLPFHVLHLTIVNGTQWFESTVHCTIYSSVNVGLCKIFKLAEAFLHYIIGAVSPSCSLLVCLVNRTITNKQQQQTTTTTTTQWQHTSISQQNGLESRPQPPASYLPTPDTIICSACAPRNLLINRQARAQRYASTLTLHLRFERQVTYNSATTLSLPPPAHISSNMG